jgi:hypothetical protein
MSRYAEQCYSSVTPDTEGFVLSQRPVFPSPVHVGLRCISNIREIEHSHRDVMPIRQWQQEAAAAPVAEMFNKLFYFY